MGLFWDFLFRSESQLSFPGCEGVFYIRCDYVTVCCGKTYQTTSTCHFTLASVNHSEVC